MLTVDAAQSLILDAVRPGPLRRVSLTDALGATLRESIESGADSPPFDKALMDGFAVRAADVHAGKARLKLVETVTAGQTPKCAVGPGETIQIMTGAPLPSGADAVVRVEDSRLADDESVVELATKPLTVGTNIMRQGTAMRCGEMVLSPGCVIRPQEIALLAEVGWAEPAVTAAPRIAILSTGDELVEPEIEPGPGQIRNTNAPMLAALAKEMGGIAEPLGIARDVEEDLSGKIKKGLEAEFLVLSGGVSAGQRDLVPKVLRDCGVREVFHKVRVKPGKPVWFGIVERDDSQRSYVFGLPGNPVSSMVCFGLFVAPAVRKYSDRDECLPTQVFARLAEPHVARGDRPTYYPARLKWTPEGAEVSGVSWKGSADLRTTTEADCLIHFPGGDREYPPGEIVGVYPLAFR